MGAHSHTNLARHDGHRIARISRTDARTAAANCRHRGLDLLACEHCED